MAGKAPRTSRDFDSLVEQRIRAAQESGEFDNLPGLGKPLQGIDRPHDELWWVKSLLKRENLEYLPGDLALRREAEQEVRRAMAAGSDANARRIVEALNTKIAQHNRTATSGPGSSLVTLDVEEVLRRRRDDIR